MSSSRWRLLVGLILIVFATAARADPTATRPVAGDAAWSQESNGLRARLSMRRSHVSNGTAIIVTYLELNNVRNIATPLLATAHRQSMKFSVTDSDGRDVPVPDSMLKKGDRHARASGVSAVHAHSREPVPLFQRPAMAGIFSGPGCGTPELVLPPDSSIRFRIGPCGWGIPADQAALVDLGSSSGWVLPRDGKRYYLQAVLEVAERKDDRSERGVRWHGRLDLPRVRIPTEPDPVDAATLGPLIDELGARMLAKDNRVSGAAVRELSLIDDPRVIPWYVKAIKIDRYSLKFNALDRLSRLEGDGALEGLKIGMATQGDDIGSATTAEVAASLAKNIRHSAANALSRSPHRGAKALLWSMEEDPATAVRITVIQTAARMETPESLALLKRRTEDIDETVRGEAARLLKLRESGSAK